MFNNPANHIPIIVIRRIFDGNPSQKNEVPKTEPSPPVARITVGSDCVFSLYISTLNAFELSLKSRCRELEKEHYMTIKNRRYHKKQFYELVNMNLLDCDEPAWLNSSSTGSEWQTHISNRIEIAKKLEDIYRIMRIWYIPAKYVIALAAYQTRNLLGIIKKAKAALSKEEDILKGTVN